MACILVAPGNGGKGVVTFTTQERDNVILPDPQLVEAISGLKDDWVIGLHHNWHDFQFHYNPLFDFSMAGEDDLREVDGRPFRVLPMDACNFAPECFHPGQTEKFWDVLYIARPVFFKKLPAFFSTVRTLYDQGNRYRVLLVTSKDPNPSERQRNYQAALEARYEQLFPEPERDLFAWWRLDFNFPFPLDMPTLAHLYRASRVFVHAADLERRCRVAAYAWASGVPVVGTPFVGSLLSAHLRRPPYFYEVPHGGRWDVRRKMGWTWSYLFPSQIVRALDSAPPTNAETELARQEVSSAHTPGKLARELCRVLGDLGVRVEPALSSFADLDLRLGRHHGWDSGRNRVEHSLSRFVEVLGTRLDLIREAVATSPDPESHLAQKASPTSAYSGGSRVMMVTKKQVMRRVRAVLGSRTALDRRA